MSIRFKFRSSVNFDTLEIGNRGSISVGELRANILRGKNSQQQQQGFDLIFSDAVSGLEYKSDDSQIPSGSSVIVKRVPGGTLPSAMAPAVARAVAPAVPPILAVKELKESHNLNPTNGPTDEFDDFGADLCPMPDSNFPDFGLEFDNNHLMENEKEGITGLRLEGQKIDSSDLSEAIPRGSNQSGNGRNVLPRVDDQPKLNKLPASNIPGVQNTNLPLELKCPLCNTFFKDAVMIPCCQHSFCEKCIRLVLTEKGTCPKCFSSKCNVENLLPNLSLRQAIVHFLESQMVDDDDDAGLENAMKKYVPDGESGIQAKDVSCAFSVAQREPELHQSSYVTGKGSNEVFMEAYYEQQHRGNMPYGNSGNRDIKSAQALQNVRGSYPRPDNIQRGSENFLPSADFQGENQPVVIPQANLLNEAESNSKRKGGYWTDTGGGERNFFGVGGHRKGVRTCYTCGSPDHLMRDCPVPNPNHMFQPGNGAFHGGMPGYAPPPYWNGSSMPPFRPYTNMYNNPAMMPFNPSMVPVSHYAVPPYIPSMLPDQGGNMRMGNMGPPRHPEYFGLQHCETRRKHLSENLGRELPDEDDDSPEDYRRNTPEKYFPEKSHDYKLLKDREPSSSHSGDSYARKSGKKTQHSNKFRDSDTRRVDERHEKTSSRSERENKRASGHVERSNSGRSSDRHSEGRHKHHHHHHHGESKSAQKDVKRRVESADVRGSQKKHHSFSGSGGFDQSSHGGADHRGAYKERDIGSHSAKRSRDKHHEEERRDDYRHHKRRVY